MRWLQEEGQVERRGRVRQRPDRDEVYAGLRDRPERLERDAAARLELGRAPRVRATAARSSSRASMLSSRIRGAPAASASSTSVEVAALDLERQVRDAPRGPAHRLPHAAGRSARGSP